MNEEELAAQAAEAEKLAKEAEAEKARLEAESNKTPKDDNKTGISDAEAKLLKEIMKLKEKAKAEEAKAKALESKISGIDLEAAKEAIKKMEETENKELERKGEYERLLQKQKEAAEKEKADLLAKLEEERKNREELARNVDQLSLGNAFANSNFIKEKLALTASKTKALYGDHFEVVDGKLVAYDKPKGMPSRTPIIDATGEGVSFEEAIKQIIEADPDKDYLLKSEKKPGAGSKGNNIDAPINSNRDKSSLDRIAEGLLNPKNFGNTRT